LHRGILNLARTLIRAPRTARRGEVIEIRTLIAHPMETGYRSGPDGRVLPRDILRRFTCRYDGEVVFAADLHPAIAANPYLAFHTVATVTGPLEFTWEGDNGFNQTESHALTVT
jgi:sulfur-oxidizing protein SoxZ